MRVALCILFTAASAAAPVALLGACASSTNNAGAQPADAGTDAPFGESLCPQPRRGTELANGLAFESVDIPQQLTGSPPFDYVGSFHEQAFSQLDDGGVSSGDDWKRTVISETGSRCSGAKDALACQAKLSAMRVLPTDAQSCGARFSSITSLRFGRPLCAVRYFAWTRGDDVGLAATGDELRAMMGTIDAVPEAIALLGMAGYKPVCGSVVGYGYPVVRPDAFVRAVAGGYQFRFTNSCDVHREYHTVVVTNAGTVTETETVKVDDPERDYTCVVY